MLPARKRAGLPGHSLAVVLSAGRTALRREDGEAEKGKCTLPGAESLGLATERKTLLIGELDGVKCFAVELPEDAPPPEGTEYVTLRESFSLVDPAVKQAICRSEILLDWRKKRLRCGICGTEMTESDALESGQICPACHAVYFPQLSPAVIVAIRRGGELLLAHNAKFAEGVYSLIAGFIEPGESAEEAVVREVREETGIEIGNLTYIRSQPWPFPNSLMLGFEAEYAGGEVRPDGKEIVDAGFFKPAEFPKVPGGETISRYLIDKFLRETAGGGKF